MLNSQKERPILLILGHVGCGEDAVVPGHLQTRKVKDKSNLDAPNSQKDRTDLVVCRHVGFRDDAFVLRNALRRQLGHPTTLKESE